MEKTILIGKKDTEISSFLEAEFNAKQLDFIDKSTGKFRFSFDELENLIYDKNIKNLFVTDPQIFYDVFLRNNFYDSISLRDLKNIFFIPETYETFIRFSEFIPYRFTDTSKTVDFKSKVYKAGILKQYQGTRDIVYTFNPGFNIKLEGKTYIFKKDKIEEGEFYIDYLEKTSKFSLISKIEMEALIPFRTDGKAFLFSNIKLKNNEAFYKSIIKREINR